MIALLVLAWLGALVCTLSAFSEGNTVVALLAGAMVLVLPQFIVREWASFVRSGK